jgi:hypothetical protein
MNIQKYFRVCVLLVLACIFAVPGFSAERIRYVIPGFDGSPKLMVDGQGFVRKQYGFLGAERNLLESRGWQYNSSTGAYYPPGGR